MSRVTECSIPDCDGTGQIRRGWCTKHYQRWLAYGDPLAPGRPRGRPQRKWPEPLPHDPYSTAGFVYVVGEVGTVSPVKIGRARDLGARVGSLRNGNWRVLEVRWFVFVDDAAMLEMGLHERFADRRIRGEWFDVTADMVQASTAD